MKRYVMGYRPVDDANNKASPNKTVWAVGYSAGPDWKMRSRPEADKDLAILRRLGVHVGFHYCNFAVEELIDGEFSIVCLDHPEVA